MPDLSWKALKTAYRQVHVGILVTKLGATVVLMMGTTTFVEHCVVWLETDGVRVANTKLLSWLGLLTLAATTACMILTFAAAMRAGYVKFDQKHSPSYKARMKMQWEMIQPVISLPPIVFLSSMLDSIFYQEDSLCEVWWIELLMCGVLVVFGMVCMHAAIMVREEHTEAMDEEPSIFTKSKVMAVVATKNAFRDFIGASAGIRIAHSITHFTRCEQINGGSVDLLRCMIPQAGGAALTFLGHRMAKMRAQSAEHTPTNVVDETMQLLIATAPFAFAELIASGLKYALCDTYVVDTAGVGCRDYSWVMMMIFASVATICVIFLIVIKQTFVRFVVPPGTKNTDQSGHKIPGGEAKEMLKSTLKQLESGLSMLLAQIWAWALFVMLKDQTYSDLFGVLTLGGILAGTGTVLNFIIMIMHPEIDEGADDK